jgi:hypothetical protein
MDSFSGTLMARQKKMITVNEGDKVAWRQGPPPRGPIGTVIAIVRVDAEVARRIGDTQIVVIDGGNDALGDRAVHVALESHLEVIP